MNLLPGARRQPLRALRIRRRVAEHRPLRDPGRGGQHQLGAHQHAFAVQPGSPGFPLAQNLPYAPDWTASAGGNWMFLKDFKLSVDAQYVDSMYALTTTRASLVSDQQPEGGAVLSAQRQALLAVRRQGPWREKRRAVHCGRQPSDSNYCTRPRLSHAGHWGHGGHGT